jgi:NADH-quinone oxidoreductase subunit K
MNLEALIGLSLAMFFMGFCGVMFRKNIIFMLMSVEIMLNAVNLLFVSVANTYKNLDGQVMVFFVITVAACEAAVGLAMVIALFRRYGTVATQFYRILRG